MGKLGPLFASEVVAEGGFNRIRLLIILEDEGVAGRVEVFQR